MSVPLECVVNPIPSTIDSLSTYTKTLFLGCLYMLGIRVSPIGHDLGQRVRIIQKRNRWVDLKILS